MMENLEHAAIEVLRLFSLLRPPWSFWMCCALRTSLADLFYTYTVLNIVYGHTEGKVFFPRG